MFITPSFKKGLIVQQFQRNYLKSADVAQVCDHSNESHWAEPLFGTVATEQTLYFTD